MAKTSLKNQITQHARALGFDLIGVAPARPTSQSVQAFNDWLKHRREGEMRYMQKAAARENPAEIVPGARTVITLAVNYYREQAPLKEGEGRVARYAYGRDYHKVIGRWLRELQKYISEIAPEAHCKAYVDTGPVLERDFAEQAGIGVIGKNACLITSEYGSWVFLAEIITTLPLAHDTHAKKLPTIAAGYRKMPPLQKGDKAFSACGGCRRCIDACPTGAIIAPGVIDARRCISYLTIETTQQIPARYRRIIKETKRIYGCDICQEVCPHNQKRQKPHGHAGLSTAIAGDALTKAELTALTTPEKILQRLAGSPLMRAKHTLRAKSELL